MKKRKFTFVEMMTVLMIMGIIFSFVAYNMHGGINIAKSQRDNVDEKTVKEIVSLAAATKTLKSEEGNPKWWITPVVDADLISKTDAESLSKRLEERKIFVTYKDGKVSIKKNA